MKVNINAGSFVAAMMILQNNRHYSGGSPSLGELILFVMFLLILGILPIILKEQK
jgi:hypothetical protein